MEVNVYLDIYAEYMKLIYHLGTVLSIALKDMTEKAENMKFN